jgi:hypothetical protein
LFQVPGWPCVALNFLLPPASTPLLAQGTSLGIIESSPGQTHVPTEDDDPQALVPHSVHQVLAPTPDSVHGTTPVHVMASSDFQAPGTTFVPPALTPAHSWRRGMAPMIVHPVAMTHDEGHMLVYQCRPQADQPSQPFGHGKLCHITFSNRLS